MPVGGLCHRGIIPAYAGSTTRALSSPSSERDHPRIRGEHLKSSREGPSRVGSSPHTRGAPEPAPHPSAMRRIIPAYAGSTPPSSPHIRSRRDHPRIRGEHRTGRNGGRPKNGIIPAYAGSTPCSTMSVRVAKDHPRIRGEHASTHSSVCGSRGSSPHTRGAPSSPSKRFRPGRIIPAYAGSTRVWAPSVDSTTDHPRIRGEHNPLPLAVSRCGGSSPHTRGAHLPHAPSALAFRIIPAYAGSTLFSRDAIHQTRDHPRIRGEHPFETPGFRDGMGSSPHTRGALGIEAKNDQTVRIIPAYAGSTNPGVPYACRKPDHPRIRGEHRRTTTPPRRRAGSSPHTRGAPAPGFSIRPGVGIIPAYAGSTQEARRPRRREGDHPRIRGEHAIWRRISSPCMGIIPAYAGSTPRST